MNQHQQVYDHLQILSHRVASLEQELDVAFKNGQMADQRIKTLQEGLNTIATNRSGRAQELEARFDADSGECKRQIQLAQDVLNRKKEERRALMGYLNGLELNEKTHDELRDFDWVSLQKLAENLHKPNDSLVEQNQRAENLGEDVQTARQRMTLLYEVLSSITFVRDRLAKSSEDLRNHTNEWTRIRSMQEKRINKIQSDNERLNILIRQCISTNEPMSEYITKNIQAKCQSFINSEDSQELIDGLKKFISRQERIIKLLQYKDNKLGTETNKLQVAKDQTHDQVKFYINMLNERRNASLSRIQAREQTRQSQTSS